MAYRILTIEEMMMLRKHAAQGPAALVSLLDRRGFDSLRLREINTGRTALHRAAEFGEVLAVRSLLALGASPHLTDRDGLTPLHLAAVWGHWRCAMALLRRGADPHARSVAGDSPLTLAAANGQPEVLRVLLAYGADHRKDAAEGPWTPLEAAVLHGRHEAAAVLLLAGADPDQGELMQPIARAARRGDWPMVHLLLSSRARPDPLAPGQPSALHEAVTAGHFQIVSRLLNFGAVANVRDGAGRTPLHLAAAQGIPGHLPVRFLLSRRADVNARCVAGATPLHAMAASVRVVGYEPLLLDALLGAGADVAAPNAAGETPLHLAAQAGDTAFLATLIRAGAPVNASTHEGSTPLHYAVRAGGEDAIHLLLDNGADGTHHDLAGRSAADLAFMLGAPHLAAALQRGSLGHWPRIATRNGRKRPSEERSDEQSCSP